MVDSYFQGERESGSVLGPIRKVSIPEVHVSHFGVIPESEPGKWHLTHQHRRVAAVCMTELARKCVPSLTCPYMRRW